VPEIGDSGLICRESLNAIPSLRTRRRILSARFDHLACGCRHSARPATVAAGLFFFCIQLSGETYRRGLARKLLFFQA
jgi:hypothetical protein